MWRPLRWQLRAVAALCLALTGTIGSGQAAASTAWEMPAGALDASFAAGGVFFFPPGSDQAELVATAHQSDGSVLALVYDVSTTEAYVTRLAASGEAVDSTFGKNGRVYINPLVGMAARTTAIAVDGAGGVLVAGTYETGKRWRARLPSGLYLEFPQSGAFVLRLQSSGALDPNFGTNGIAWLPLPIERGTEPNAVTMWSRAEHIAVAPNGSIVVGEPYKEICEYSETGYEEAEIFFRAGIALTELNDSGGITSGFGQGGTQSVLGVCDTEPEELGSLGVSSANEPFALSVGGGHYGWQFRSYAADGAISEHTIALPPQASGWPTEALVLPGGDILVNGSYSTQLASLVWLTPAGQVDPSFGSEGAVQLALAFSHIALASDGKILVGGVGVGIATDLRLERRQPNGALDETFGQLGSAVIEPSPTRAGSAVQAVVTRSDGRIGLVGQALVPSLKTYQPFVAVFERDAHSGGGAGSEGTNTPPEPGGHDTAPPILPNGPSPLELARPMAHAVRVALSKVLALSLPSIQALRKSGGYSMGFTAPTAGTLTIRWTLAGAGTRGRSAKSVLIACGSHSFAAAGRGVIRLRLTAAGRRLLRKDRVMRIVATANFAPANGAVMAERVVTIQIKSK